jgi:hypothetical protein
MVPADLLNHNCLNFLPQTYRSVWPLRDESKDAPDDKSPSRYEALGNVASNSDNFLRVLAWQSFISPKTYVKGGCVWCWETACQISLSLFLRSIKADAT